MRCVLQQSPLANVGLRVKGFTNCIFDMGRRDVQTWQKRTMNGLWKLGGAGGGGDASASQD